MITNRPDLVEVDVEVVSESKLAVFMNDGYKAVWIPKSQMEDWPDIGETGTALMTEWIATEKGLI